LSSHAYKVWVSKLAGFGCPSLLAGSPTRYQRHQPERFVKGLPRVPMLPTSVAINRATPDDDGVINERVNFPTLAAAGFEKSMLSQK